MYGLQARFLEHYLHIYSSWTVTSKQQQFNYTVRASRLGSPGSSARNSHRRSLNQIIASSMTIRSRNRQLQASINVDEVLGSTDLGRHCEVQFQHGVQDVVPFATVDWFW